MAPGTPWIARFAEVIAIRKRRCHLRPGKCVQLAERRPHRLLEALKISRRKARLALLFCGYKRRRVTFHRGRAFVRRYGDADPDLLPDACTLIMELIRQRAYRIEVRVAQSSLCL
jgi:hypothetical protein